MSWPRKIKAVVDEFGPVHAFVYLMHRAFSHIGGGVYLYHFVAQPVPAKSWLPSTRGRTISVRPVDGDDPGLKPMPLDRRVLDYRFAQHAICLGAFKDGQMIGYLWLCLGPYREDEVRCNIIPAPHGRASWDFDVYLLPEHRVGLGFLRLWDEANQLLRARGVAWSMSRISALNRISLASHFKLGAQHLGTAAFIRVGRMQLALASLRPRVHLSFGMTHIPEFVLRAPDEPIGPIRYAGLSA